MTISGELNWRNRHGMPRGTWRPFLELYVWQLDGSASADGRREQSRSGGLLGKLVSAVQAVKAAVTGGA